MESESNVAEHKTIRKSKFEALPSTALQRIFSFVTYEQVSRLREVSKVFNETGKVVLNAGHRRVKHRLRREMAAADQRVICPANYRLSYDSFRFLNQMSRAINNCASVFLSQWDIDNFYFIPGKILDDANDLLKDFNNRKTVSYFTEHVCGQSPHPVLRNFLHLTERAYSHFNNVIIPTFLFIDDEEEEFLNFTSNMYIKKKNLVMNTICEGKILKREKNCEQRKRERTINCGEEMSREFLKTISKLKTNVQHLTQKTIQIGEELERLPEVSKVITKWGECKWNLTATNTSSVGLGNFPKKRSSKLASLPSFCVQTILSYLSYQKISRLRAVNKSFDEAGKNLLNKGCESLKAQFLDEVKYEELVESFLGAGGIDHYEDTVSLFLHCVDHYEWYMGDNCYFVAGKVLDGFSYFYKRFRKLYFVDDRYSYRPHYCLFHQVDLVHQAVNHFKSIIVPKYFRNTQKRLFIPVSASAPNAAILTLKLDYIASGSGMSNSRKKDMETELLKLDKVLEDQKMTIRRQNERNKKYLNIILCLHKAMHTLKTKILEERNSVDEWKMLSATVDYNCYYTYY